jgi:hypothetical protein
VNMPPFQKIEKQRKPGPDEKVDPNCSGTGRVDSHVCPKCHGSGVVPKNGSDSDADGD